MTPGAPSPACCRRANHFQDWQTACTQSGVRLAIPQHEGRVSPVFDVAGSLLLVDLENGREVPCRVCKLSRTGLAARAAELRELGVDVLLCGAISAPLEALLMCSGVRVISFLCGPVEEVVKAYVNHAVPRPEFWMPGCGGPHKRFRAGRRNSMSGGSGMGFGRGGGGGRGCVRGAGRGSGEGAGMGGPEAGGPAAECVCPNCGQKAPHTPGRPCRQMACPKCGAPMTRV
ncbi:MAG: hypothetical protein K6T61_08795 [Bryobacteraceae bacterium]|nr:hypothetical protein [Bryobacteraceae bacterium]